MLKVGDLVRAGGFHGLSIVIIDETEYDYATVKECHTGMEWIAYDYKDSVIISKAKTNETS